MNSFENKNGLKKGTGPNFLDFSCTGFSFSMQIKPEIPQVLL